MMNCMEAAKAIGAQTRGGDVRFDSVSTDTRSIGAGALFVALRGERFDGHDYLQLAHERGAVAAMVAADAPQHSLVDGLPLIVVSDTRIGLGALAHAWRERFKLPLIGVVGSNGKTTVKEMCAAILRAQFGDAAVLATAGNFNNDIGLPLTLLRLRATHACAVVEIGMNHPGETATLARIAAPTIALVNNAQREHQEFMQSVADVAQEHAAVIHALSAQGLAVFNADDAHASLWRAACGARTQRDFGLTPYAAVHAEYQLHAHNSDLDIETPLGRVAVTLNVPGVHNVRNALAAIAATTAAGATLGAVARGLNSFSAVKGRLQVKAGKQGAQLIDDSYNANPDSVRAAIDVLAHAEAPRVLVLGDMGEVGEQGPAFHAEIGAYAKQCGIEHLLAIGPLARASVSAFGVGAEHFDDANAAIERAQQLLVQRPTLLIKGSRFMHMERVVDALLESAA